MPLLRRLTLEHVHEVRGDVDHKRRRRTSRHPFDPRFTETPGYSFRLSADAGAIVYAQSPELLTSAYLRVVPHWVDEMKRRVH